MLLTFSDLHKYNSLRTVLEHFNNDPFLQSKVFNALAPLPCCCLPLLALKNSLILDAIYIWILAPIHSSYRTEYWLQLTSGYWLLLRAGYWIFVWLPDTGYNGRLDTSWYYQLNPCSHWQMNSKSYWQLDAGCTEGKICVCVSRWILAATDCWILATWDFLLLAAVIYCWKYSSWILLTAGSWLK